MEKKSLPLHVLKINSPKYEEDNYINYGNINDCILRK